MKLRGCDVVVLAPDVTFGGGTLTDHVRGRSWPANDTAAALFRRNGSELEAIANDLVAWYGVSFERALDDVVSFATWLNSLLLLNVRMPHRRRRRLAEAVRLLFWRLRVPPPLPRRYGLGRRRTLRAAFLLAPRASMIGATCTGAMVLVGLLDLVFAGVLGGSVAAGLILHEAAHVAALRRQPAALVIHGSRIYVLHRSLAGAHRMWTALAGPLVPAAVGLAGVALAAELRSGQLAAAGCALAAHALGATVVAHDGRVACDL